MMGDVVQFPTDLARSSAATDAAERKGIVLILPVIRIEREPGCLDSHGRRRRRSSFFATGQKVTLEIPSIGLKTEVQPFYVDDEVTTDV